MTPDRPLPVTEAAHRIAQVIMRELLLVAPKSGSTILIDDETGVVDFAGAFRPIEIAQAILETRLAAPPPEADNPWREAVIDELVVAHIYSAKHDGDPKLAIHDAIAWNVTVALDPRVSQAARDLQASAPPEADTIAKLPAFDITKPISVDQDGALAVAVLDCFAHSAGPFTTGDAERIIEAIQRLRQALPTLRPENTE